MDVNGQNERHSFQLFTHEMRRYTNSLFDHLQPTTNVTLSVYEILASVQSNARTTRNH
jgi:hypothetical protein